jgi:hypothetical protein
MNSIRLLNVCVLCVLVELLFGCTSRRAFIDEQTSLANVALVNNDPAVRVAAMGPLTPASRWVVCRFAIATGDESRIPELLAILEKYGTREIALLYVNSGQPQLAQAGTVWARGHGYHIVNVTSPPDHVSWGSGNPNLPFK